MPQPCLTNGLQTKKERDIFKWLETNDSGNKGNKTKRAVPKTEVRGNLMAINVYIKKK